MGKKQEVEQKYCFDEIVAAAESAFGVKPEIAHAALKLKGLTETTREEAQAVIDEFMNKEA